jgi:hypothetical protein
MTLIDAAWFAAGLVLVFIFLSITVSFFVDEICLNKCYQKHVNCSQDDNNCIGGNHYCYDLCIGGTTKK